MKLTISKSKNAEQLYITKSIRINKNKTTSQIIVKLGSMSELLPKFDNDREKVIAWAKEQAKIYTEAENQGSLSMQITLNEGTQIAMNHSTEFNIGYLFPKMLFHQMGLKGICRSIAEKHEISYSLCDVLQMLISARLIAPASKLSSCEYAFKFLQQPSFDLQHVYRSLDVLCEHSDEIQAAVYESSKALVDRNKDVLFYDCTNYFFEIEDARGDAQYGKSKENRPNPIVQMGLFLDGNGFPLSFCMFAGNKNEQLTLKPLEKKILKDFKLSEFIVCTDAGLASTENRKFNAIQGHSCIVTQSLKTLKGFIRDWALEPNGWKLKGSGGVYNIYEIDDGFYAVCTTLEKEIGEILHINKMRWQIEAAFRTMKSEFKARPVYLRNDERNFKRSGERLKNTTFYAA